MGGKGACPPEDCGGVWGYEELKSILENPKHPDHKDTKKWLGLNPEISGTQMGLTWKKLNML